jgi:transposase
MKLHANAALSLTQRRRMVRLVLEDGWTIRDAAAAFNTSSKTCGKWVGRYRASRESGLLDKSSAPETVANRTEEDRIALIAALRRLRFTGPELAELARHAALDGVGDPDADRHGTVGPAGSGAGGAL